MVYKGDPCAHLTKAQDGIPWDECYHIQGSRMPTLDHYGIPCALVSMPHAKEPSRVIRGYLGMPKCSSNDPNLLINPMSKCGSLSVPWDAKYL